MAANAGVNHIDALVQELERDGEMYVPSIDGTYTYRIKRTGGDHAFDLSWFVDTGPRHDVLWAQPERHLHETDGDWRERTARGFLFAILSGIDLRSS